VNDAYAGYPVWGLCPYDTRTAPPGVIDDVCAMHPHVADQQGKHRPNDQYVDARSWLARHPSRWTPMDAPRPGISLSNPTPRSARQALAHLARERSCSPNATNALLVSASEAVTNACLHGTPPRQLDAWTDEVGVTVSIRDAGPGPRDPFAGLVPPVSEQVGGRGLWLVHQLATDVRMSYADGFEIRFSVRVD
jgi:anti-sigma regulatory factor (Ser/Thr protein kinase)